MVVCWNHSFIAFLLLIIIVVGIGESGVCSIPILR